MEPLKLFSMVYRDRAQVKRRETVAIYDLILAHLAKPEVSAGRAPSGCPQCAERKRDAVLRTLRWRENSRKRKRKRKRVR